MPAYLLSLLPLNMYTSMLRAVRMIVSGQVQDVGFRLAAKKIASYNNIVGYVKNLEDYTVEILCEGEDNNIDRFIEEIKKLEEPIIVNDIDIRDINPTGSFNVFKIVVGNLGNYIRKVISCLPV